MKRFLAILLGTWCLAATAAEVIPPVPQLYFNDYASVVSSSTRESLNGLLAEYERKNSSQVVVAIYPKMPSDSSIEDYTVRVAQAWRVGQKGKDNGVVLFVFIQDRKMYIQVGYGLEGALPDVICKRIIEDEIKPHFKQRDYDGGLRAGVAAILTAMAGEYQGTGRTVAEQNGSSSNSLPVPVIIFFIVVALLFLWIKLKYGFFGGFTGYSSGGWSSGGGAWSSGGGGGFSSGGGSFGGGGAGGSW